LFSNSDLGLLAYRDGLACGGNGLPIPENISRRGGGTFCGEEKRRADSFPRILDSAVITTVQQ
jgi:hypothetical protein